MICPRTLMEVIRYLISLNRIFILNFMNAKEINCD